MQSRHKKGDKWRAKWGDLSERKLAQGNHGSGEWDRKDGKKLRPKEASRRKAKKHGAVMRHTNCETQFPVVGPVRSTKTSGDNTNGEEQ